MEISRIARMMDKMYDKHPWYGPALMEVLSSITEEEASRRIGSSHTITELVLHMTSWRNFVTSRLTGNDTFQVAPEANFPKATNWADAINTFRKSQENLMSAVAAFPDTRLGELVPAASHKYTFYTLVHGILQHDIYHLGQIQLIRKSNM